MGKRNLLFLVVIFVANTLIAQTDKLPVSIRGEVKLPVALSNKPLKKYMNEVGLFDLSIQKPIFSGYYIGAGANFLSGKIDEVALPGFLDSKIIFFTPFLNLGFEKAVSEVGYVNFGIKSGYSVINFKSNICRDTYNKDPYKTGSFYIEPHVGYYINADDKFIFGFVVSSSNYFHQFSPERFCLNEFDETISEMDQNGISRFLNVGFDCAFFLSSAE